MTKNAVEWSSEQVSAFWDYQASRPSADSNYFSSFNGRWVIERAAKLLNDFASASVLDLGCGPGYLLEHIVRTKGTSGKILGVDYSFASIERAQQRLNGKAVRLLHVTGARIEVPSDSIDAVFCVEVVEHLSDQYLTSLLSEAHRILRSGGLLFVTTPNGEDLERQTTCCPACSSVFHIWQHLRSWNASTLQEAMERNGFTTVCCEETFLGAPAARMVYSAANRLGILKRGLPHLFGAFRKASPHPRSN